MDDREKVIQSVDICRGNGHCEDCHYCLSHAGYTTMDCRKLLLTDALALLKEQEKLVDVDALREKLGLAKDCAKCKQNTRACQYDSHFSLMDFCERFDMAIDELMQEGR